MTSANVEIFRATTSDLELARQAIAEGNERAPVDPAALATFLADTSCYLILAVEVNRVIGSLNGYALRRPDRPEPQFLLYEIDVRSDCRNRGVGKALVAAFTAEARAAGAHEVWVLTNQSNAPAMAMYLANGYRRPNPDDVMLNTDLQP